MSGDSGRSSNIIELRAAKLNPTGSFRKAIVRAYKNLCNKLGYRTDLREGDFNFLSSFFAALSGKKNSTKEAGYYYCFVTKNKTKNP